LQVEWVKGKALSHWDLSLGSCLNSVTNISGNGTKQPSGDPSSADPAPGAATAVKSSPLIKWDTSGGTFTVTMDKVYQKKDVPVLAKTANVYGTGTVSGPDCTREVTTTTPVTATPVTPVTAMPTTDPTTPSNSITIEGIVRDFSGWGTAATKHVDFEQSSTKSGAGCVESTLGADGKPVASSIALSKCNISKLSDWYNGTDPSRTTTYTIELKKGGMVYTPTTVCRLPKTAMVAFTRLIINCSATKARRVTSTLPTKFTASSLIRRDKSLVSPVTMTFGFSWMANWQLI